MEIVEAFLFLSGGNTPFSGNQWLITEIVTDPLVEELFGISGIAFGLLHAGNALAGAPLQFVAVQTLNTVIWGLSMVMPAGRQTVSTLPYTHKLEGTLMWWRSEGIEPNNSWSRSGELLQMGSRKGSKRGPGEIIWTHLPGIDTIIGQIAGIWKRTFQKGAVVITTGPFRALSPAEGEAFAIDASVSATYSTCTWCWREIGGESTFCV